MRKNIKLISPLRLSAALFGLMTFGALTEINAEVVYAKALVGAEHQIGNMLEWETALESNSNLFIVEKSVDGIDFEKIGVIQAAGNTDDRKDYRYLDINTADKSFYRLRQVDNDGTISTSQTILLKRSIQNDFMVVAMSNTLTNKDFTVSLDAVRTGNMKYELQNDKGEVIFTGQKELDPGLNNFQFDVEDEKEGIYNVVFILKDERETLVIRKVDDEIKKKENVASKKQSNGG